MTPTPPQTANRRRLQNYTEPSRAASATLHLCVTRAHIAHGRATARAAGTSGLFSREGGQAHRQEATQEGAPPGEGGAVCFVFRCCAATASVVQLREVEPVEVAFASNSWAHRGKEARALHISESCRHSGRDQTHWSVSAQWQVVPRRQAVAGIPPPLRCGCVCRTA